MNTSDAANPANPATAEAPAATVKVSAVVTLNTKIAETIAGSSEVVLNKVIKTLADKEIDKRATSLLAGLEAANAARSELRKLDRPDVKPNLGRDGKPVGEGTYTEARIKEIKKVTEKLAKIERAIDKATDKSDYADLFNLKSLIEQGDKAAEGVIVE